ncbi:MAG: hypothetical protein KAI64_02435, partial [Thermoplasmata archaeon]|nr:hypothetical protein [Thermoplasmata archaeon]
DKIPIDPIKELYEGLVAEKISRKMDKKTLVGATDALITDFCKGFDDDRIAMSLLRQEILRAGVDIRSPSKERLLRAVEYLAEAEAEYKDEKTVKDNRDRRLQLLRDVKE